MKTINFIIEQCFQTKLLIGYIPGVTGAHSQGECLKELISNLKEVCELIELNGYRLEGMYDDLTIQFET